MKEKLDNKVYKVMVGKMYITGGESDDVTNHTSETLVAPDVVSAIEKIKLEKNQYISEVTLIATLTK